METSGRAYGSGMAQAVPGSAPMPDHACYAQDWAAARTRMDQRRLELAMAHEAAVLAEKEERECWARLNGAAEQGWAKQATGGMLLSAPRGGMVPGFASPLVLALVAAAALLFGVARAEEPAPAPAAEETRLVWEFAPGWTVAPGVAFSGSAYDLRSKELVRGFQIGGLLELEWKKSPVAIALGLSGQGGETLGLAATQLLTIPRAPAGLSSLALGLHEVFVGENASLAVAIGSVFRF